MSIIFNALLNMLNSLVSSLLPSFELADSYINNISDATIAIRDFIAQVNFIIPLPDIALIIAIDIGIRMFKLTLFVANWVIRRIVDAVP